MRFSAAALLLCLGVAVALVSAEEDYDYGDDSADALDEKPEVRPQAPAPRRPALPTASRKSPLSRSRTPATSPPPPPPPPQAEEPQSEEEDLGEDGENAPVTEASTKKPLIRGGVRPFRSNQDLLETLKRRRQNIRVSTHAPEDRDEESASSAPSASTTSRRRFSGGRSASKAPAASTETEEPAKAKPSSRNGRRFSSSRGRVAEEEEQPQPVVAEEPKSRTGRRRF